jgi:hypothetical protein
MKRSTGEHLGRVTISVGVASLQGGDTAQSLIERADSCLYAAKRAGRNRVISEGDPEIGIGARRLDLRVPCHTTRHAGPHRAVRWVELAGNFGNSQPGEESVRQRDVERHR